MKDFLDNIHQGLSDYFHKLKIERHKRIIDRLKPGIVTQITNEIDKKLHKQYDNEIEKLQDDLYKSNQLLKKAREETDTYRIRYEESQNTGDKLLQKVESISSIKGEVKKENKTLKAEVKELKESKEDSEENTSIKD